MVVSARVSSYFLLFIELKSSVEVNKRFIISEAYNLLPINIVTPRFLINNDCKKKIVMNNIVLLNTS